MASVNPHTRELVFKLVFYGPGLGGKTTMLQYVHGATKSEHRGKMVSLATPTDRTLYFDYLPIRVPRVRGLAVRLQLFTVPGQVYYAATRKLVLSGADGLVFVADSQVSRLDTNQEAFDDLVSNLEEHHRKLEDVPHAFHWNKRDLPNLVPVSDLERRFNLHGAPSVGTVATRGEGVFEGLEQVTRLLLQGYVASDKDPLGLVSQGVLPGGKLPAQEIASELRSMEVRGPAGPPAQGNAPVRERAPSFSTLDAEWGTAPDLVRGEDAGVENGGDPATSTGPDEGTTEQVPREADPELDVTTLVAEAKFSLADLFGPAEREGVRLAEGWLAGGNPDKAVLACDALMARVLASAAALMVTTEAPRDPALVAVMLGIEGPRYLRFRALIRAAREQRPIAMRDAFECFLLAVEAGRARDAVRA